MKTIQIQVKETNALEVNRKENALAELSNLDIQDLEKLVKLKNSKQGLDYLQNKWFMLTSFLGI